jgi:hypothetical protein
VKLCPGARLKGAAALTIERCQRRQALDRPGNNCRLSVNVLDGLLLVTCACGAASIWLCNEQLRAAWYSFAYSTGTIDVLTTALRSQNCVMLLMPSTRSSTTRLEEQVRLFELESRHAAIDTLAEVISAYARNAERKCRDLPD